MSRRVLALCSTFAFVNLALLGLAMGSSRTNLGTLATPEEASSILGADCIKPEYANPGSNVSVCCGWHFFFGYPGTDYGPSYQNSPLFEADNPECTCSGTYVTFSDDICFGG